MTSILRNKKLAIASVKPEGLELINGEYIAERTVRFAFTTNKGGYSKGTCSTLNLSLKVDDDEEHVLKNRKKLLATLNKSLADLLMPEQVHGEVVTIVTKETARPQTTVIPESDGLITVDNGVVLMALFADCIPVLLFDKSARVAGVIHAGWRGTHKSIVINAVNMINDNFRINPEDLIAIIGPGIADCCYQIGDELSENFADHPDAITQSQSSGQRYLNLKSVNKKQLESAGLNAQNIHDIDICTSCDPSFFSYRRDSGSTGRHAAIIYIENNE